MSWLRRPVASSSEASTLVGPYEDGHCPDNDTVGRLDLGSVRFPVPEGAQLQLESDPSGPLRAVHVLTSVGRITITALAAPRSEPLWPKISDELTRVLRQNGARVRVERGQWGTEVVATSQQAVVRFVGVDRPRWMLHGVGAGPVDTARAMAVLLRDMVRGTVVSRGTHPLPVRTPLPLSLPDAVAHQLAAMKVDPPTNGVRPGGSGHPANGAV